MKIKNQVLATVGAFAMMWSVTSRADAPWYEFATSYESGVAYVCTDDPYYADCMSYYLAWGVTQANANASYYASLIMMPNFWTECANYTEPFLLGCGGTYDEKAFWESVAEYLGGRVTYWNNQ